jgi:hypothetical protein
MSIFKLTSVSKKEGLSTRVLCVIEFPFPEENVPIHNSNKLIFSREFYFANTISNIDWINLHFSANRVRKDFTDFTAIQVRKSRKE